ncbi:MAG: aminotransferase class I/II-fold pyridoxal phosphate-dependent enzyme, partial [Alphaproteobacteria bacterium]|nr:aminotransferase class I/II-fold pyridoxal phosphate-dependent enzyme [Alphaproteobacteria bacterium]
FPGLRLGYLVVPRPLLRAVVGLRQLTDRQPSTLHQTVVAAFMREGHFAAHIRRMRQLYRGQRDALVETLRRRAGDALDVALPDQGMHLVALLAKGFSERAIERAARDRDLIVRPLSAMYIEAKPRAGFLLGFTGFPKPVIVPAAARLADIVRRTRTR